MTFSRCLFKHGNRFSEIKKLVCSVKHPHPLFAARGFANATFPSLGKPVSSHFINSFENRATPKSHR